MWKSIFQIVPSDGQVVWVRVQWFFGTPVVCTYDATLQQFTSNIDGVVFPCYIIGRWKEYTAPSPPPIGSAQVGVNLAVG